MAKSKRKSAAPTRQYNVIDAEYVVVDRVQTDDSNNAPVTKTKAPPVKATARSRYRLDARTINAEVRAFDPDDPDAKQVTLYDGDGLEFVVTGERRGKWIYRYVSPTLHRRREKGLGAYPGVTLAAAREAADALRDEVDHGRDPLETARQESEKQRAASASAERDERRRAATLRECIKSTHKAMIEDNAELRSAKHKMQWRELTLRSLPAAMLDKPIAEVGSDELLEHLRSLRRRIPETARRTLQRLQLIYADAVVQKLCDVNTAQAIAPLLREKKGKGTAKSRHFRAMHYRDVPTLVRAVREATNISLPVRLCFEWCVLSASRSGEARGAVWGEIDRARRLWIVPGHRYKTGDDHRCDLSPRMLEILDEAAALRVGESPDDLIFPAPRNPTKPLSDMSLTRVLRFTPTGAKRDDGKPQMFGDLAVMHSCARASFSTFGNDGRASSVAVEVALGHREQNEVKASYDRSREQGAALEREVRGLRLAWAQFVAPMAAVATTVDKSEITA